MLWEYACHVISVYLISERVSRTRGEEKERADYAYLSDLCHIGRRGKEMKKIMTKVGENNINFICPVL